MASCSHPAPTDSYGPTVTACHHEMAVGSGDVSAVLDALDVSCAMPMDLIQIRAAGPSLPRGAGTADTLVAALFGTPVLSAKSAS